jgi:hypothetical protein
MPTSWATNSPCSCRNRSGFLYVFSPPRLPLLRLAIVQRRLLLIATDDQAPSGPPQQIAQGDFFLVNAERGILLSVALARAQS